jgi:hypothetical protein
MDVPRNRAILCICQCELFLQYTHKIVYLLHVSITTKGKKVKLSL